MSLVFVHLSDIHFGQEKGGHLHINDDVKEQLLADAREFVLQLNNRKADGIIISGDIAYGGKPGEYDVAGKWLDRLTAAVGCGMTAVQIVPGNHDIDLDELTEITQRIIDDIIDQGEIALDRYLASEADRELLYRRFHGYRKFAEAYDCPLDSEGRISKDHVFEIGENRKLKFLGLNTALICSKSKKEYGGLILGKRQHVISAEAGLETVVIAHHPLNWIQDSDAAARYIRNRARVFISGHEHSPSHKLENIDAVSDLVMLASGAAAPPKANAEYNYCYNILEFEWVEADDTLNLNIYGRTWDADTVKFTDDLIHFQNGKQAYKLNCPNFKKLASPAISDDKIDIASNDSLDDANTIVADTYNDCSMEEEKEIQLVLLRFFRDLSSGDRLSLLIELSAIPSTWNSSITHGVERIAFDKLVKEGKLSQIHDKINQILQK